MNGTEKIIEKIMADAAAEREELLARARSEAEKIAAESAAECAKLKEDRAAENAAEIARREAAAASSAALLKRSALLRERRAQLGAVIEAIPAYLNSLEDGAYFAVLYACAASFRGATGVLRLNARDLARLPADFLQKMAEAGVTATVSPEAAPIVGGFILQSGDIDLSADFGAMIHDRREALEDEINRRLFAEEAL